MGPPYISKILKYQYEFQRLFPLRVFFGVFSFYIFASTNFKTEKNPHAYHQIATYKHTIRA